MNAAITIILIFLSLSACTSLGHNQGVQNQQIERKTTELERVSGRFSFVVLGDNRSGDEAYKKLLSRALELNPLFIVNTGDQISTPGSLSDWARFWDLSKPIAIPYFLTVGNHDIHPQVPLSDIRYREQVDLPGNELYYSFNAGNALFVVLDSQLGGEEKKITGEQLAWLEKTLAENTRKHIFVFVHHPLYPAKNVGKHYGNSLDRYPPERDALQALFVKYAITAVFTGHEHLYLKKIVDGIPHVITGGGGAPLYSGDDDGGFHHFIVITVDGDEIISEVIDIEGKVRDKF